MSDTIGTIGKGVLACQLGTLAFNGAKQSLDDLGHGDLGSAVNNGLNAVGNGVQAANYADPLVKHLITA